MDVLYDWEVNVFEATEALFRPELVGMECGGLSEMVFDAIQKADVDLRPVVGIWPVFDFPVL